MNIFPTVEWHFGKIHLIHNVIFYMRKDRKKSNWLLLISNLNNKTSGKRSLFFGCFRTKDYVMNIMNFDVRKLRPMTSKEVSTFFVCLIFVKPFFKRLQKQRIWCLFSLAFLFYCFWKYLSSAFLPPFT